MEFKSFFIVTLSITILPFLTQSFQIEEATIKDLNQAFADGDLTSIQLVDFYLNRIQSLNPLLCAVVEVNPDARDLAEAADRRRRNGGALGELDGIPVLVKDVFGTRDKMNTTAGSYALVGAVVARDAGVVERLREAGAVVMGKTSLSEWYKFRDLSNIPNGWCARAGQGLNPYVLHSGSPCGSSSGSAISVTANLVAVSLGTETHSSITCPADHNSVVGLKPTVGLTSRAGVIPMTPRWDTIGPICRTVSDAVYVLDVISGFDPRDVETNQSSKYIPMGGYKQFLKEEGLRGKRIGVIRKPFLDKLNGSTEYAVFEQHINTLRQKGATVVDNLEIANIEKILNPKWSGEYGIMLAEFRMSINEYLQELVVSPVRSLADIIAFNKNNIDLEKVKEYNQQSFVDSDLTNGYGEKERKALETLEILTQNGFQKLMVENELDAMVTPGSRAAAVHAIGGYPAITVPAGYDNDGTPFGICFGGLKFTEPKLIEIAYAFEQATNIRVPPPHLSSEVKFSDAYWKSFLVSQLMLLWKQHSL